MNTCIRCEDLLTQDSIRASQHYNIVEGVNISELTRRVTRKMHKKKTR